jgi:hypothetical protein
MLLVGFNIGFMESTFLKKGNAQDSESAEFFVVIGASVQLNKKRKLKRIERDFIMVVYLKLKVSNLNKSFKNKRRRFQNFK